MDADPTRPNLGESEMLTVEDDPTRPNLGESEILTVEDDPTRPNLGDSEMLTVEDDPIRVELLPACGARLHRLRVFGHDLLRTPDNLAAHIDDPLFWGAYVMAPWCNRVAAMPTEVGDEIVRLRPNSADGSVIHGQVYSVPWAVLPDGSLSVRGGGGGWPWPYETTLRVSIVGRRLTIQQTLENLGTSPMPGGLGIHPWFRRPLDVQINAARVLTSNLDPEAPIEPVSGQLDLRKLRPMPEGLDAAWLDPRDPAVELRWPELGVGAVLRAWSEAGFCIVAASPGRLNAVAIEPQTHLPQGLRRLLRGEPGGLHLLAPGAGLHLTIELAFFRS